jgi:hypothetical protein
VSQPPSQPKIYHITHVDNLESIVGSGAIASDRMMVNRGGPAQPVGMSKIKLRRLNELAVSCHPGDKVGDYVPFYFCPRSIMLFILHRGNHPELAYTGGQEPIVHLEADLESVVEWAGSAGCRWAFSTSNAGAYYTPFFTRLDDLDQVDWAAVSNTSFSDQGVKERKQAEFLLHNSFPWSLVSSIGVYSVGIRSQVHEILAKGAHRPPVAVEKGWYY